MKWRRKKILTVAKENKKEKVCCQKLNFGGKTNSEKNEGKGKKKISRSVRITHAGSLMVCKQ